MESVIPRTLKRFESYQTHLYKTQFLARLQKMTRGELRLEIDGDNTRYSFGLGNRIKAHLRIRDEQFFSRFLRRGDVGFGESYVDGAWDSEDLVALMCWFLLNIDEAQEDFPFDPESALYQIIEGLYKLQSLFNTSSHYSSFDQNISYRYDLDRRFYGCFLDESLTYSCGIFDQAQSLEDAQLAKNRRIGQQLKIQPGDHVLEVGSGFGSLALYLALTYSCKVTAVTVSEEQHTFLKNQVDELDLKDRIFPKLMDFREIKGSYDKIVSIELIDSLLAQDLPIFFQSCRSLLKNNGVMVHQVLLKPETSTIHTHGEWVEKYITPGALTPTLSGLLKAANQYAEFKITELHDMGGDYAQTLQHWYERFSEHKLRIRQLGYDDSFIRSWEYYLAYAQAAFRLGILSCAQVTMARPVSPSQF